MSELQFIPGGGPTTVPKHEGDGAPTTAMPMGQGAPPPPTGPFGPLGLPAPQAPTPKPTKRGLGQLAAVAVLAAVLASGATAAASHYMPVDTQSSSPTSSTTLGSNASAPVKQGMPSAPDWAATASVVSPSVVSITATTAQGGGQGSGVIIDKTGRVLTNNHVVAGADKLTVTLADGRTYDAGVRGTDPSTDLAVITISKAPSDLTPIAIGDSDKIAVGDPVMAVGNPLGLAGTVTTGIVSALNRPVSTQGESQGRQTDPFDQNSAMPRAEPVVTNAVQTSAAINPGNSGGALVNASGQLIGINSSIASLGSSSGGQSGSIGIGFAIPVHEATSVAKQLIDTGTATHAYLGVTPQDGSASDGSATRAGAEVTSVGDGTPAAEAGLKVGDVIVAVNGERVESAESLIGHIRGRNTGDEVTLTVLRDGNSTQIKAALAAKPTSTKG